MQVEVTSSKQLRMFLGVLAGAALEVHARGFAEVQSPSRAPFGMPSIAFDDRSTSFDAASSIIDSKLQHRGRSAPTQDKLRLLTVCADSECRNDQISRALTHRNLLQLQASTPTIPGRDSTSIERGTSRRRGLIIVVVRHGDTVDHFRDSIASRALSLVSESQQSPLLDILHTKQFS